LTVSLGDTAGVNKFRVVDSTGKEVFSVDSSGVVTASEVAMTSDEGRSMGRGTVISGTKRVSVASTIVGDSSQIIVTFGGDYSPASRYWFESIVPSESFDVVLDQDVGQEVPFVWWVVNQE